MGAKPKTNNFTYQHQTDQIISALQENVIPWKRGWAASGGLPLSCQTGKPYRGSNVFTLAFAGGPYDGHPWWITSRNCEKHGIPVVKRGRSFVPHPDFIRSDDPHNGRYSIAVYWHRFVRTREKEDGELEEFMGMTLRFYPVWNVMALTSEAHSLIVKSSPVAQKWLQKPEQRSQVEAHAESERIISNYLFNLSGPSVVFGGDQPAYSPPFDRVYMPEQASFFSDAEYYSTYFHELTHSTGNQSRLARDFGKTFGEDLYCKEELVAEMGASFLCAVAGVDNDKTVQNSVSYIDSWLRTLREPKNVKLVAIAGAQAQKAADHILGVEWSDEQ